MRKMRKKKSRQVKPIPDYKDIYRLAEQYYETSLFLKESSKGNREKMSAPRILVDSFAVELYLKCLYVLDKNAAPPGVHEWDTLFDALASHTKAAIREAYDRIIKSDPVLSNIEIINPEAGIVKDFNRSLIVAKNTFDKGRYSYEKLLPNDWFYAHVVRDAIRDVTRMDIRLASVIKDLENEKIQADD